jgi:hypothetical protein
MSINLQEKLSLNKVRESLRMMSKSEGGIGLEQGIVDLDHIASLIHFL